MDFSHENRTVFGFRPEKAKKGFYTCSIIRDVMPEGSKAIIMAKFTEIDGKLYIDGKRVLRGWESYSGWYWFAIEKVCEQKSYLDKQHQAVPDVIWFGFVQGFEEEWGEFSQAEIESLSPKTWEIPSKNLPWSGRR